MNTSLARPCELISSPYFGNVSSVFFQPCASRHDCDLEGRWLASRRDGRKLPRVPRDGQVDLAHRPARCDCAGGRRDGHRQRTRSPAPSITKARAARGRSFPLTAAPSRNHLLKASCSAIARAPSPTPSRPRPASSSAHGGTLFLDEVDSLSPKAQVALLRFLQERTIRRVGETLERPVDVRVVAASSRSLEALVEHGLFRSDLFYRLNIMYVMIPPLRERGADIELLAAHFIAQLSRRYSGPSTLDAASIAWLHTQPWPGNVRQLENFLEREYLLGEGLAELRFSVLGEPRANPNANAGTTAPPRRAWWRASTAAISTN